MNGLSEYEYAEMLISEGWPRELAKERSRLAHEPIHTRQESGKFEPTMPREFYSRMATEIGNSRIGMDYEALNNCESMRKSRRDSVARKKAGCTRLVRRWTAEDVDDMRSCYAERYGASSWISEFARRSGRSRIAVRNAASRHGITAR